MTLEELLYRRLTQAPGLRDVLARYRGTPAVFYQRAPADTDAGWGSAVQYPRLDFMADLRADPERQTAGVVSVNLWCTQAGPAPEDLEPQLRAALCGALLAPEGQPVCALAWARSDGFEFKSEVRADDLVSGVTVLFDLYAFPDQVTGDPDPVQGMFRWAGRAMPEALVIGRDPIPDAFVPTAGRPALYFRVERLAVDRETFAAVWYAGTLVVHLFAPEAGIRVKWLRAMVDDLARAGEVTLLDGSPMLLRSVAADSGADPLSAGQLRLGVRWGALRRRYAHPLNHINRTTLKEG